MATKSPSKLIDSPIFQGLIKKLVKQKLEHPWWDRWEPDHSTEVALENEIKNKCPELFGTIHLEDLNRFIADSLLEIFPEMRPLPAPIPGGAQFSVDVDDAARKISQRLSDRLGVAVFRYPLFRGSFEGSGLSHDFGSLGSILVYKSSSAGEGVEVSSTAKPKSFAVQVEVHGFLFEGASALTSIASERTCALLVFLWLTHCVNFHKGRPRTADGAWKPLAFLSGDSLDSAIDLSRDQNGLADAERLCSWSLFNDSTITITIGLATAPQHSVSPIIDAKTLGGSFNRLAEEDAERFRIAFHFFASSITASTSAHAILNLCIALECALGWELARGKHWNAQDNRGRIEARLETSIGGEMSKRVNAKKFVTKLFEIRNSIAHGKTSSAVEAESLNLHRQGIEYFRRSCLFYIRHLEQTRR